MSTSQRDALRQAIAAAPDFQSQVAAVEALAAYDAHQVAAHQASRDVAWADTVVAQTLQPVAVHERSTVATDWLGEARTDVGEHRHAAMAEAAGWFGRTSAEVRADVEEFGIQAEGFMRREASKYGEDAPAILSEGLTYLGFLHRQAASGLDQVQQTVDSQENPKPTQMPTEVFDNFADQVHPINAPVVGTETSERAPLLQEIEQEGAGQGQPEVAGGHTTTNMPTGPTPPFQGTDATSGPLPFAQGSVAINHTMTLADFIQAEAASGLDQVEQVVDAHENPRPTALPTDVQFPWLIGPDAYGNGGDTEEKDQASRVATREGRAPFAREAASDGDCPNCGSADYTVNASGQTVCTHCGHIASKSWTKGSSRKQAGGDFDKRDTSPNASSWYDHPDYDRHYQYGHDSSGRFGEPIQFRDHEDDDERGEWGDAAGTHDLSRAQYEHSLDFPDRGNGAQQAFMDGWSDRSNGNTTNRDLRDRWRHGSRKQADMFGNSDNPHQVAGPEVANNGGTTPAPAQGFQQGLEDAQAEQRPTYADASSGAPAKVQQYSKGYSEGVEERRSSPAKDFPVSMGGDNGTGGEGSSAAPAAGGGSATARRSDAFVKAASRSNSDFAKGYAYASRWEPGKPLVTTGSPEFEAGLFAGRTDAHRHQGAWVTAHQATKDPQFKARLQAHVAYANHLAEHGIDLTAATSTDLDTMDGSASPSPTGDTPINGPGTPPPLAGGEDPARPGGPAPYNGAAPIGGPGVVPTGFQAPTPGSQHVDTTLGGPVDQSLHPSVAFRQTVQANLLRTTQQKG